MKHKNSILLVIFFFIIAIFFFLYNILIKTKNNESPAFNILPVSQDKSFLHSKIRHVFVIIEENHDWQSIYKSPDAPYINSILLPEGAYASNYRNVPESLGELHPSELNYILLESGKDIFSDHTFINDDPPSAKNSTSVTDHLVTLLEKNGYTWKSYQEDILGTDCPINPINNYAPKHNPFVYFQDVSGKVPSKDNEYCKTHIRPLSDLENDLKKGNLPNYIFITPNLQHDMHDGTISQADTWLSKVTPLITGSSAFKKDGALFITWDEGKDKDKNMISNNPIGMIIESPFIKKNYTNSLLYSHASLLKTIEEIFNITPLLGFAGDIQTQDLLDLFVQNK